MTATLYSYHSSGRAGPATPWLSADGGVLTAGVGEEVRQRWVMRQDIDRVIIETARPLIEGRGQQGQASRYGPLLQQRSHLLGTARFFRGHEEVLRFPLADWGAGPEYQFFSPAWNREDPATASGAAALIAELNLRPEFMDPAAAPVHAPDKDLQQMLQPRRLFSKVSRRLGWIAYPLFPLGILCIMGSVFWPPLAPVGAVILLATGLQFLGTVLFLTLTTPLSYLRVPKAPGNILLQPYPATAVPAAFLRRAHIRSWGKLLAVRDGDGVETTLPLPGDRNGPASAVVEHPPQGEPQLVKLVDSNGTSLVELDWHNWFSGPDGYDSLNRLCRDLSLPLNNELVDPSEPAPEQQEGQRRPEPVGRGIVGAALSLSIVILAVPSTITVAVLHGFHRLPIDVLERVGDPLLIDADLGFLPAFAIHWSTLPHYLTILIALVLLLPITLFTRKRIRRPVSPDS